MLGWPLGASTMLSSRLLALATALMAVARGLSPRVKRVPKAISKEVKSVDTGGGGMESCVGGGKKEELQKNGPKEGNQFFCSTAPRMWPNQRGWYVAHQGPSFISVA